MRNKILGVFLEILAILFISLALVTLSVQSFVNPIFYKNFLRQNNLYTDAESALKSLPMASDTKNLASVIIPKVDASWIQTNIETNLNNLNSFLQNKIPSFAPTINIAPFKTDISQAFGGAIKVTDIPNDLTFSTYGAFLTRIQNAQSTLKVGGADTNVQIDKSNSLNDQMARNGADLKHALSIFKIYSITIYILAILMLILIAVAARYSLKSMFRWLAAPLLIVFFLMFSPPFVFLMLKIDFNAMFNHTDKLTPQTTLLVGALLKGLSYVIANNLVKYSAICGGIGLLLLIISFFLPKGVIPQKSVPAPTPAPQPAPAPTPNTPQIKEVRDLS